MRCEAHAVVAARIIASAAAAFPGAVGHQPVDKEYIKEHTTQTLVFMHDLMSLQKEMCFGHPVNPDGTTQAVRPLKPFTLLPVCALRRHYLTLDCQSLYKLLLRAELVEEQSRAEVQANHDATMRAVFKLRPEWRLGGEFQTDGVGLSIGVLKDARPGAMWEEDEEEAWGLGLPEEMEGDDGGGEDVLAQELPQEYFACDPGEIDIATVVKVQVVEGDGEEPQRVQQLKRSRFTMTEYWQKGHLDKNMRRR